MSHLVSTERSSDGDDDDFQSIDDDENKDDKGDEFDDNNDSHNSDGDDVGNVGDDNDTGGGNEDNMGIDGGHEITEEQELLQQIQELTLEGQVEDLDESDSTKIKIHEYVYYCFLFNRRNALAKKGERGEG